MTIDAKNVQEYTRKILNTNSAAQLFNDLPETEMLHANTVLGCIQHWSRCTSPLDIQRGSKIIVHLLKLHVQSSQSHPQLVRALFGNANTSHGEGRRRGQGQGQGYILESYMENALKRLKPDAFLDVVGLNSLNQCWNLQRELFQKLEREQFEHITLKSNNDHDKKAMRNELDLDMDNSGDYSPVIIVTRKTCNIVLDALAKSKMSRKGPNSIEIMESIIERMKETSFKSSWIPPPPPLTTESLRPDVTTYHSLLYAHSQKKNGGKNCEQVFRHLQQMQERGELEGTYIGHVTYNIVIRAWARSAIHDRNAASRAEALLREMQEKYEEGMEERNKRRNKRSISQSGNSRSSTSSSSRTNNSYYHRIRPTLVSFTTVIDAWAKASKRGDVDAASRAEAVFDLLMVLSKEYPELKPNTFTWSTILNAWGESSLPGAAERAEGLLRRMMDNIRPTMINFSICIKAWAGSDQKGSAHRALALLQEMQGLNDNGFDTAPDIGTFNSVLRALSNDSSCDESKSARAEELLCQIRDIGLSPDATTYNTILRCCSSVKSGDMSTRRNALRIAAETLLEVQESSSIEPDCWTFNYFIKTCDRLSHGREKVKLIQGAFKYCIESGQFKSPVLSLLKNVLPPPELKKLLRLDGQDDIHTKDLRSLKVGDFPPEWSNDSSSDESKCARAEELLRQIRDKKLCPDITTYNTILRCCSSIQSRNMNTRRDALRIAAETLLQIQKSTIVEPDCWTFNYFIKACDRLSNGHEKVKLIEGVFKYCIESGELKSPVLSLLINVVPPSELKKLLRLDDEDDMRDLRCLKVLDFPREWSGGQRVKGNNIDGRDTKK